MDLKQHNEHMLSGKTVTNGQMTSGLARVKLIKEWISQMSLCWRRHTYRRLRVRGPWIYFSVQWLIQNSLSSKNSYLWTTKRYGGELQDT